MHMRSLAIAGIFAVIIALLPATTAEGPGPSTQTPEGRRDAPRGIDVSRQFDRDMKSIYERARSEAGYNATYFLSMLAEHGGVATARKLVAAQTVSDGFTSLWQRQRLDLTVEALVLRPEYAELFTDDALDTARQRLHDYGSGDASQRPNW